MVLALGRAMHWPLAPVMYTLGLVAFPVGLGSGSAGWAAVPGGFVRSWVGGGGVFPVPPPCGGGFNFLVAGGSLSPVECRVEGFPRGAFAACEGGGLEESLPAWSGVFWVYFWGVGLGSHEESVCPVEDPPLGVRFEDVDGGTSGGRVQGVP